jgi:hypothetical protein
MGKFRIRKQTERGEMYYRYIRPTLQESLPDGRCLMGRLPFTRGISWMLSMHQDIESRLELGSFADHDWRPSLREEL